MIEEWETIQVCGIGISYVLEMNERKIQFLLITNEQTTPINFAILGNYIEQASNIIHLR